MFDLSIRFSFALLNTSCRFLFRFFSLGNVFDSALSARYLLPHVTTDSCLPFSFKGMVLTTPCHH